MSPNSPQLSIIIPTFNAAGTISKCLASIVAQSYRAFEVLVVDGRSTDRTVEIVAHYATRFPFIRCLSEPDAGIYDAMNKGVARCASDWVYFIGCDDELANAGVLASLATHFDTSVDFIHGNIVRMTTGRTEGRPVDDDWLFAQNICHQAIVYRRELFVQLGQFNLDYKVCADWEFNIRCFGSGCRTRYVDLTICNYDGGGFSARTTDHVFLARKLSTIARAYGVPYWNRRLRSCRYDFFDASVAARSQGRYARSAGCYLLYAYHAALAGGAVSKVIRRARLAMGRGR